MSPAKPTLPPDPTAEQPNRDDELADERDTYYTADWPTKGGDAEQPWAADEPEITPRAGLPVLTSGSADPSAPELFAALADLGYESPTSRGERAHGVIGGEEMAAVRAFRNDYNVREDPSQFGGDNPVGREVADNHIGPWTQEAILRAREQHERQEA